MIRIIINADDCGYSPEVNSAIDFALSRKAISSTTIMANSIYLEDVHKMVERHPEASFGIHLNLTEGPSLTKSPIFREMGITDSNDCFIRGNSKRCPLPNKQLAKAIHDEWDAQMDLLINKEGFSISHVDGHHHCHSWIGLQCILVNLMQKYGINKTRNKYFSPYQSSNDCFKQSILRTLEPLGRRVPKLQNRVYYYTYNRTLESFGIQTTDFFGAYEELLPVLKRKDIKDCTLELMCHPGLKMYNDEFESIIDNAIGIDNNKYKLISYKEL